MRIYIEITTASLDCHRARCPSLPGCYADAATPEAAVEALKRYILSYLLSLDAAVPAEMELIHEAGSRQEGDWHGARMDACPAVP